MKIFVRNSSPYITKPTPWMCYLTWCHKVQLLGCLIWKYHKDFKPWFITDLEYTQSLTDNKGWTNHSIHVSVFANFIWCSTSNSKCHVMFLETKMSVNGHLHFYSKLSPQFWLTQYSRKNSILNNKYAILICNHKTQNKLSIESNYPSVLHVSPNVEDGSPIHCINFEPTNRNPHKSIKGLQVQPIAQMACDCILFGKCSFTLPCFVPS